MNYMAPFPWQESQWKQLYSAYQMGRLPQAILLVGQAGLGKTFFAEAFSKTLLCKHLVNNFACSTCSSCRLMVAGTHPNFFYVAPEQSSKVISINQVRFVNERLSYTTTQNYRIVLINPIDSLLAASSNALLKNLEEPNDPTLFILISEKIELIPMTIRSRCQIIRFFAPKRSLSMNWVNQQLTEPVLGIETLYHFALGAPLQILSFAKEGYYSFYIDFLTHLVDLANKKIDPIQCAAQYLHKDSKQVLNALTRVICELLKYQLIDAYRSLEVTGLSNLARRPASFLLDYYDYIVKLHYRFSKVSINLQLMLEELFSYWALGYKPC